MTLHFDDPDDQEIFSKLAFMLGAVCGSMTRPGIKEALIDLASSPEGEFTLAAIKRAHHHMGQVISAVEIKKA